MTSMGKLAFIAAFGFCAVLLGSAVLTLDIYVAELRRARGVHGDRSSLKEHQSTSGRDLVVFRAESDGFPASTVPAPAAELSAGRKARREPQAGVSWKGSGEFRWQHATAFMEWDALQVDADVASSGLSPSPFVNVTRKQSDDSPRIALQLAAQAGNPCSQFYAANAFTSGIWPVPAGAEQSPGYSLLGIMDEMLPSPSSVSGTCGVSNGPTREIEIQYVRSLLNWRMAAAAGNVEAAMAMAYRLDMGGNLLSCQESITYYQAVANAIIDDLEMTLHSRAKALPPQDKHILAQVHVYGGSSSQLDWNNKPDETKEALQFYHLKATTWQSIDVDAAFTLAHLYHHGVRGVPQNLTLALNYYQIAADYGHWESAGHAGMFYLYGMGSDQDLGGAYKYFQIGAPNGLDGCRQRHDQSLRFAHQQKKQRKLHRDQNAEAEYYERSVVICDSRSVNGMGMLHMFGIQDLIQVDLSLAEKYFLLAREMGSVDAHYNLGMLWLGFKSHYKKVEDLQVGGTSGGGADYSSFVGGRASLGGSALHVGNHQNSHLFEGPVKKDYNEAIKLLGIAANKGHLQARHRLGIIYSRGVKLHGSANDYDAIKPDCMKARSHFQWIVDYASPHRSKRLRLAYKQYAAGDLRGSLYNYLAAAETGSNVGLSNAAFLLEHGVCLGLSHEDCSKASVRLWKAAAARGSAEACLRVGDFYYYGPSRRNPSTRLQGPFGWIQNILYPDRSLLRLFDLMRGLLTWSRAQLVGGEILETRSQDMWCKGTGRLWNSQGCSNLIHDKESSVDEDDLAMAAQYYRIAVERHDSPRANFNLGFMHQWGIGLTQDFPLAKRHYDLAASGKYSNEAGFAVQTALTTLYVHEQAVKMLLVWEEWLR